MCLACASLSNVVEHTTKLAVDVHLYVMALRLSSNDHFILWQGRFTRGIPALSSRKLIAYRTEWKVLNESSAVRSTLIKFE